MEAKSPARVGAVVKRRRAGRLWEELKKQLSQSNPPPLEGLTGAKFQKRSHRMRTNASEEDGKNFSRKKKNL